MAGEEYDFLEPLFHLSVEYIESALKILREQGYPQKGEWTPESVYHLWRGCITGELASAFKAMRGDMFEMAQKHIDTKTAE